jgi:hypothetical protein
VPWLCRSLATSDPLPSDLLYLLRDRLRGTLAPFFRASESPIAMACLRLFTFPPFPPRPLRNVPFFFRRMALSTRLLAAFPYRRVLLRLLVRELLRVVVRLVRLLVAAMLCSLFGRVNSLRPFKSRSTRGPDPRTHGDDSEKSKQKGR